MRPLVAGDVTIAVQDVAFTHDFDLAARRGHAYAAVLAVHKNANERGSTSGAVYRSADLRTWEKVGGASSLDAGATAVAVAPDGRVFASYLDITTKDGGVLCTAGTSWGDCPAYRTRAAASPGTTAPGSGTPAPSGETPRSGEARGTEKSGIPGRAADRVGGEPAIARAGNSAMSAPALVAVLAMVVAAGVGTAFVRRRATDQTGSGHGAG